MTIMINFAKLLKMNIETQTTRDIVVQYRDLKRFGSETFYIGFLKQGWINVDSLLAELERQIDAGNMEGVGGHKAFSAPLFLSELKKAVEARK